MNLVVLCDSFFPEKNSCANLMTDLCKELAKQNKVILLTVKDNFEKNINFKNLTIHKIKCFKNKQVNYGYRFFGELLMPFFFMFYIKRKKLFLNYNIDAIISYSPSIFFSFLTFVLKKKYKCKNYLILRDIFPEWAYYLGIIKKNFIYRILKKISHFQYEVADFIGLQSTGDLIFMNYDDKIKSKSHVLYNWQTNYESKKPKDHKLINFLDNIKNETNYVYAGNIGIAQDMGKIFELASNINIFNKINFIFFTDKQQIKNNIYFKDKRKLKNVYVFDKIPREELKYIYQTYMNAGIISLKKKHKTNNIPGKFLDYLQAGLPIFADINKRNDLSKFIRDYNVGEVNESDRYLELEEKFFKFHKKLKQGTDYKTKCNILFNEKFLTIEAVSKISSFCKK